jgi:uncharacterized protein (TIGR03083 family)
VEGPSIDYPSAIAGHSSGFAEAVDGNLDANVEHCPGWTVADLAQHLTTTQWFWATIVEERLSSPPPDDRRPAPVDRELLVATFQAGAERLVGALRSANGSDPVYTWAPTQHDVAFIARHQAQEAAVHHWDAAHAAGRDLVVESPIAVDAIEEFLTFSSSTDADPAEPARPALNGQFGLRCTDVTRSWTISDGIAPGTVAFDEGVDGNFPTITASSSDLLLWLYGRVDLDANEAPADLLARFRALCFTD